MKQIGEMKHEQRKTGKCLADARHLIQKAPGISEETKKYYVEFLAYLSTEHLKDLTIYSYAEGFKTLSKIYDGNYIYLTRTDIHKIILNLTECGYAQQTILGFKKKLLRFVRWFREEYGYPDDYRDGRFAGHKLDPGDKPTELKGIKLSMKYRPKYGPEDLPTQNDVDKMIDAAYGIRNRAMVAVLYESGARLDEFRTLKIRAVERTPYGLKLHVDGKTGRRPIMLINSGPYLSAWLSLHPFKNDLDAPLWVAIGTRQNAITHYQRTGEQNAINKSSVNSLLKEIACRADVQKAVNPHAFRHGRATELAKVLTESQLRAFMGWFPGSPMPGIYVHLSGRDTEKAILAAYGIKTPDSDTLPSPKQCPRCGSQNSHTAKICVRCSLPLDAETSCKMEDAFSKIGRVLPDIVGNEKAMRDFRRLLHKHKIESNVP